MNTDNKIQHIVRNWSFAILLVVALIAAALITTAVTNAVTGGQALDQLRSYYIYLTTIFKP